jgi:hypothetical protein
MVVNPDDPESLVVADLPPSTVQGGGVFVCKQSSFLQRFDITLVRAAY